MSLDWRLTLVIYLDPRRGSGDLLSHFTEGLVELLYLDSGDVMGVGNSHSGLVTWGIEIKKLDELVGSMNNGRLVEQVGKMQEDYDYGHRYLLVEGNYRSNPSTGALEQHRIGYSSSGKQYEYWKPVMHGNKQKIQYSHFSSWLMSILIGGGIGYLHTSERQETADLVTCIAREYDKKWDDRKSLKVFNNSSAPPGLVVPSIPMCVARDMAEDVGWEKSIAAAEHFKTVRAMSNATAKEWQKVPGFGKVLAERMVEGATREHKLRRRERKVKYE